MSHEDRVYYTERMECELNRAGAAIHPKAAKAHLALACLYRKQISENRGLGQLSALEAQALSARSVH